MGDQKEPKPFTAPQTQIPHIFRPPSGQVGLQGLSAGVGVWVMVSGTLTTVLPSLLLSAIVHLEGATPDGHRIRLLGPAWHEIGRLLRNDPDSLRHLNPRQWEEIVAAAYDRDGYEVELTPRSGDLGRDVIAIKRGFGSVRIIDQVKAYSPGHRVTANDVRALLFSLLSDPTATKGIVTTTSDFAPRIGSDRFISPYIPFRLELINGVELNDRLNRPGL